MLRPADIMKRWGRPLAIIAIWGTSLLMVDRFPFVPSLAKLFLAGLIGGAATLVMRARSPEPATISPPEPPAIPHDPAQLRHELRTSLNLMLGFCEALLHPQSSPPMPVPYRSDVEAIYRNGQQLATLIDQLASNVAQPVSERTPVGGDRPLLLLDESGAVFELFNQYMRDWTVVRAASIDEIGRLDLDPAAVIIAQGGDVQVPLVVELIGDAVPIFSLRFQAAAHRELTYLAKPVQFDELEAVLHRSPSWPREILIVDDSRDTVELLSRMLTSLPETPRITKAYTGREALALLKDYRPDLILMDFVLPDMDGRTLLDYLNIESRLTSVPVVLMSAHRLPDLLPLRGLTKLTFFHMARVSPLKLARQLEVFLTSFTEN